MNLALFDLDQTLLPLDSDHAFGEFLVRRGLADKHEYQRRNDLFFADYQAGNLDIAAYIAFVCEPWQERPLSEQELLRQAFMAEVIEPAIHPTARELVQRHRDRGDLLALVTATNDFVTLPIAAAFGFETLIATRLERDEKGFVTGRIAGVPNLREGKVHNVEHWLRGQGLSWGDFSSTWCYSDSTNDLPLLERVTHPTATNPGVGLEQIARARSWPILQLFA